ncbi:hypothetical protein B9N43_14355 [Denitratisoma sp. DHT3]|uniref:hypothetical protein n=1 Tax=Denitratisoma sp. DHT3 TaxID=1981880 RepID=UPI0011984B08|nr:hypothetical protein [Denitratisoma sp. DHT3]QDX82317.1 hypothetical protein B9N43_14355 [Denitratisoma sp. DHT3]
MTTAQLNAEKISSASILHRLHQEACLDLRQLAALHHVASDDPMLFKTLQALERAGKIRRIGGGKGRRTSFVLSSFDI